MNRKHIVRRLHIGLAALAFATVARAVDVAAPTPAVPALDENALNAAISKEQAVVAKERQVAAHAQTLAQLGDKLYKDYALSPTATASGQSLPSSYSRNFTDPRATDVKVAIEVTALPVLNVPDAHHNYNVAMRIYIGQDHFDAHPAATILDDQMLATLAAYEAEAPGILDKVLAVRYHPEPMPLQQPHPRPAPFDNSAAANHP